MLAVALSHLAFVTLRYVPSILTLLRLFFCHKWMFNFLKCFFCIYWDNLWFFTHFVNVAYHADWFFRCWTILAFLILILRYNLYCLIQFANILLRISASMFMTNFSLKFSFLCGIFVWFWYQGSAGFLKYIWKCSLLFNFGWLWKG